MRLALLALLFAAVPAAAEAEDAWVQKGMAELILLDKIRAQPTTVAVKVGDSAAFGSITVKVRGCYSRPPDQPTDATAFVEVLDSRGKAEVFHGWIFENTPAISVMEHPVYDVRLAGCR